MSKNSLKTKEEICHQNVARWTKKHDIFSRDVLIFPINDMLLKHWYLVIVLKPSSEYPTIALLDSYYPDGSASTHNIIIEDIKSYLHLEAKMKNKKFKHENVKITFPKVPQQQNNIDCGVFLLHYVEEIYRKVNFNKYL